MNLEIEFLWIPTPFNWYTALRNPSHSFPAIRSFSLRRFGRPQIHRFRSGPQAPSRWPWPHNMRKQMWYKGGMMGYMMGYMMDILCIYIYITKSKYWLINGLIMLETMCFFQANTGPVVFASKIAGTQLSPRCYHRFSHTSSPKRTALEMKQPRASSAIQLLMFDFESAEIDAISRWHHMSGLLRLALLPQGRVLRAADGEPFACHTHRFSLRTPSCASSVERSTIFRWGETLEDSTHKLNVFFAFVLVSASDKSRVPCASVGTLDW
jgi:hypothetical protein